MECSQSLIEVLTSRNTTVKMRRLAWTLFFMGVTLSAPVCFGQRLARPAYNPASADAYFSGDSNRVFPNPNQRLFERFQAEPGDSNPVPNREVRMKNRAERRENFQKRFGGGAKKEEKELKNENSSSSTVTYPDSERFGRNSMRNGKPMRSPAPFLWDSQEPAKPEEITKALPFHDPENSKELLTPVPHSIKKKAGEAEEVYEADIELEDVTIPAEQNILPPKTEQAEPEVILEDITSAVPTSPAETSPAETSPAETSQKTREESTQTEDFNILEMDSEELTLEEQIPPREKNVPRFRGRFGAVQKPEIEKSPNSQDVENTEPSEEAIDLILEPVPKAADSSRQNSILETTGIRRDFSVQQVAFFSSENGSQGTMQYPVRKKSTQQAGFNPWSGFSKTETKKKTDSEIPKNTESEIKKSPESEVKKSPESEIKKNTESEIKSSVPVNSSVQADSINSTESTISDSGKPESRSVSFPEYSIQNSNETLSNPNESVAGLGRRRQRMTTRNETSTASISIKETQPTQPRPASEPSGSESVIFRNTAPVQSSQNMVPTASTSGSTQDQPTYNPPFPELNVPTSRLEMTQPVREVFKDFGIRKSVEKSALPWYAEYIRDLDLNEEHLFNSLRVLGNTKLSQSRCQFSLMEASIIASQPKTAEQANHLLNIYENIEFGVLQKMRQVDAQSQMTQKQKEELKAELILDFMHQKVFVKYVLEGTTINNLLEHGYYNCVTASLLFCSLAEKAGLNVTAVELPGHAMCWVYLSSGERLAVETTCSNWFKYRNDPVTQQKVICKLIRDASPQLKDQSDQMLLLQIPQPISDKRLIAKIYYNRGVDLLSSGDYAGALEANAIAYCLDPQSETTFGNLLATMNNWAIALCRAGQYEEATALLREGIRHQPDYPPFKNNHTHVYHHWVDSLYRNGQMTEALQIAALAAEEQPDVDHFRRLQEQIQQNIAILNQKSATATR